MQCEQVRDLIIQDTPPPSNPALKDHLNTCTDCADLYETYRQMQTRFQGWQNEPVPAWDRVHLPVRMQKQSSFLATWGPLAVAAMLVMAVVLRVEVVKDKEGYRFQFGSPPQKKEEPVDTKAIQAYVDQAVERSQTQVLAGMETMLETYKNQQDKAFTQVAGEIMKKVEDGRQGDMQFLLSQWDEQRAQDLEVMDRQIRMLMTRQKRTNSNLYQLADYVQRQPNYLPKEQP